MHARFGNFRTLRVAFDRERLLTRTGRIYLAGRYDLWKDSFTEEGATIPYADREPQPIVFYGNVKFPTDMVRPAQRMAEEWNRPFAETVAYRQGRFTEDGQPDVGALRAAMGEDMFQFRSNDCNPDNVTAYANANGLGNIVQGIAGDTGVRLGNVEQVCAAVQFAELQNGKTLDPRIAARTGRGQAFTWQRKGDLRYNMQNYITQDQPGPWGVAQFGQDPETGEYVGNVSNYFGDAGDRITNNEVDLIQWLNGDLSEDDLFRGNVAREAVSRRLAENTKINGRVLKSLKAHEDSVIDSLRNELGRATYVGAEEDRFAGMWAGTDIEKDFLLTDEVLRGFAGPNLYQPLGAPGPDFGAGVLPTQPPVPGLLSDAAREAASLTNFGVTTETNEYMVAAYQWGRRAVGHGGLLRSEHLGSG